jgi:hypothetical protein
MSRARVTGLDPATGRGRGQSARHPDEHRALGLQRAIGNRAVGRLVSAGALQRQTADPAADQTADQTTEPTVSAEREVDARWHLDPSAFPDGMADAVLSKTSIAVAFYEAYETGSGNDAEFKAAGNDFAKTYGTLGVLPSKDSASLVQGAAIPVKDRDDVAQALTSLHQALYALAYSRAQEYDSPVPSVAPVVDTVAIFAHGVRGALGLDPQGETGRHWFRAAEIPAFVAAIKPHVAPDVRVLLFACSTGATSDKEANYKVKAGGAGGTGSFGEQLANALGGGAKVYAHDVYGHTESNPFARVFAAGSDTGRDMFDVMYDQEFVDSEVQRLNDDKSDLIGGVGDEQLAAALRKQMWAHFVDAVQRDFVRINTHNRHFAIGGYGGVGAAMFMDPTGTAATLHDDFRTVWLTDDRIKRLGS